MSKHALVLALLGALAVSSSLGCSSADPSADDQAPIDAVESEANAKTKFTRLDTTTPDDIADAFVSRFNSELDIVLAAHPAIQSVTKSNVGTLTAVGSTFYLDLSEAIVGILDQLGQASARPSTLRTKARAWALAKLGANAEPLALYEAKKAAAEKNAFANAAKPRGVVWSTLRAQWAVVQSDRGTLDSSFLVPVKVDKEPSVTELKKHFGISSRLSLTSWGWDAVDDMNAADEGPNKVPSFKPVMDTLKHGIGVKKRFFFSGGGQGWSNHVLIVIDEKNQLWGFSMGYSE
jgi:hypothetical protein